MPGGEQQEELVDADLVDTVLQSLLDVPDASVQPPPPTERPPTTAATLFELLASTMASAAPMSPPQQLPIPPTPAIDLASASLNPSIPRVRSAGNLGASPPDTRRTGKPPRPRSSNNLLALADAMAPPRVLASPVAPNRQAAIRDLFNTLVKLIEAHLPAAQQHKLHELKQTIAKLKAKKDRAGLHAPLDAFFALVHKWAPREQWVELQKTANQAGIRLLVDAHGNVQIRKRTREAGNANACQPAAAAKPSQLRVEMLKQQATRAALQGQS